MNPVVLGLGSNCGDRIENLRRAIRRLNAWESRAILRVSAISPFYESDAMLPEGAESGWDLPFLNLAILGEISLVPLELLARVKEVELELGRKPRGRWAPREVDIDILAMGERVFEAETLAIPHHGLLERPFALLPLADLLPKWRHPVAGKTAMEWVGAWTWSEAEKVPFRTRRAGMPQAELMGILNLTPDSFSDGGIYSDPESACQQAERLVKEGATVLDLGAESTRPGATPISAELEWRRLAPVLERLPARLASLEQRTHVKTKISIDTRHAQVAARALEHGVNWINDVSGGSDPEMRRVVARSGADFVVMHSLSVPADQALVLPRGEDPIAQLLQWAEARIQTLANEGIDRSQIIFDPGVGFGKTADQSLAILRNIGAFTALGVRILVGHSRKSFLASSGARVPPAERDLETASISQALAKDGVDYLRVHDVGMNARVLRAWSCVDGVVRLGRIAP